MSRFLLACIFLMISGAAFAQPGPPPDPDVPITGIEILLALGGFLGVRKLISSKKNKQ